MWGCVAWARRLASQLFPPSPPPCRKRREEAAYTSNCNSPQDCLEGPKCTGRLLGPIRRGHKELADALMGNLLVAVLVNVCNNNRSMSIQIWKIRRALGSKVTVNSLVGLVELDASVGLGSHPSVEGKPDLVVIGHLLKKEMTSWLRGRRAY
jgi:hypothetical protein